ncbi:MAG: MotA/TolQ/ExbB proton channel family protein [Azospirillaceae bacterium]|nr:MotA/TolQ/ExbB proton channel family protein [Azospirillaceae bacterium]
MPKSFSLTGSLSSTLLGLVGAVLLFWFVANRNGFGTLWNPSGLAIVGGGVTIATLIAFRLSELLSALVALSRIVRDDSAAENHIAEMIEWARVYQTRSIQASEEKLTEIASPFLRLGLQLVLDALPTEDVLQIMNWRIQKFAEQEILPSRLFRTIAGMAPAFGLLATLVGLIGMMADLGSSSISTIGRHMSVALVATLYGVVLANMVFKPIAIKLEQATARDIAVLNVMLEGILLIRLGRSPASVAEAMGEFLRDVKDEVHGHR